MRHRNCPQVVDNISTAFVRFHGTYLSAVIYNVYAEDRSESILKIDPIEGFNNVPKRERMTLHKFKKFFI